MNWLDIMILVIGINWFVPLILGYSVLLIATIKNGVEVYDSNNLFVVIVAKRRGKWFNNLLKKLFPQSTNLAFGLVVYLDDQLHFTKNSGDGKLLMKKNVSTVRVYKHEMCHVKQQMIGGLCQWILYSILHLVVGYENNIFEKQAKQAEKE